MRLKLDQIQSILNADFHPTKNAENSEITSVCRDTNDVVANALFVCIVGQRFDGHDFAKKAVELGAKALLVSRHIKGIDVAQFVVSDTVKALALIAKAWRETFKGKVIAITGSAGKTTLKECLAQVLESAGKQVAKNKLNYNNQIGLPLSMLAANGSEDYWVMEAGISQVHDMDELGSMLLPDMALVLNVGAAHTEGLGEKGVAWHKVQLLKYIKKNLEKQAFVCADYEDLLKNAKEIYQNICLFTSQNFNAATYKAKYLGMDEEKRRGKYEVIIENERFSVETPFYGSYGAENIAAIAAVAHGLGLQKQEIIMGLEQIKLPEQRFNVHEKNGWCVIDDTYNANALSMRKMLEATVQRAGHGPCYAVLGTMGELGSLAEKEHEVLGQVIASLKIKAIFWKGAYAQEVLKGLKLNNYAGIFENINCVDEFSHKWNEAKLHAGTVLCKGSRSNRLEELVNIILTKINI